MNRDTAETLRNLYDEIEDIRAQLEDLADDMEDEDEEDTVRQAVDALEDAVDALDELDLAGGVRVRFSVDPRSDDVEERLKALIAASVHEEEEEDEKDEAQNRAMAAFLHGILAISEYTSKEQLGTVIMHLKNILLGEA